MVYSEKYKESLIDKCVSSEDSLSSIAASAGVPKSTLRGWFNKAKVSGMSPSKSKKPGRSSKASRFSAEEKLRILNESSSLEDSELGAFLRSEGLHESDLAEMRKDALSGLTPKAVNRGKTPAQKRVLELERELSRKDKALSEAAALLLLKKKYQTLLEEEGDDTEKNSGGKS